MVQEVYVLKCVSCGSFQSQIVKKISKWECKVCCTKQSIKKVYGRGSGRDCRLHTQKLNSLKGERDITKKNESQPCEEFFYRQSISSLDDKKPVLGPEFKNSNKWAAYLDDKQLSLSNSQIHNYKMPNVNNEDHDDLNSLCYEKKPHKSGNTSHSKPYECLKQIGSSAFLADNLLLDEEKKLSVIKDKKFRVDYLKKLKNKNAKVQKIIQTQDIQNLNAGGNEENNQDFKEQSVQPHDFELSRDLSDVDFQIDF